MRIVRLFLIGAMAFEAPLFSAQSVITNHSNLLPALPGGPREDAPNQSAFSSSRKEERMKRLVFLLLHNDTTEFSAAFNKLSEAEKQEFANKPFDLPEDNHPATNLSMMYIAAAKGNLSLVHLLSPYSQRIETIRKDGSKGDTPLSYASLKGHDDVVDVLSAPGKDGKRRYTREDYQSALDSAAAKGHVSVIKKLVKNYPYTAKDMERITKIASQTKNHKDTAQVYAKIDAEAEFKKGPYFGRKKAVNGARLTPLDDSPHADLSRPDVESTPSSNSNLVRHRALPAMQKTVVEPDYSLPPHVMHQDISRQEFHRPLPKRASKYMVPDSSTPEEMDGR